jgi:hypothetical protein
MKAKREDASVGGILLVLGALANVIILEKGITVNERWYFFLLITVPVYITMVMSMRKDTPG